MYIRSLQVRDVRNLGELELEIDSRLNVFEGPNGSGKTALLEAIHILARGRSFRTSRLADVPRYGQPGFTVVARIHHGRDGEVVTGVTRNGAELSIRYRGEPVAQMSIHARRFPVTVATPASQELLFGSPKLRRKWLDWGLFHVEQTYLEQWRQYHRAMRQRNCLLKMSTNSIQLDAFEREMSEFSADINAIRARFLRQVEHHLLSLSPGVLDVALALSLEPGWDSASCLADTLARSRRADAESGFARHGPHRADIRFVAGGRDAAMALSRGQTKVLVVLLAVALRDAIGDLSGESPVLLLDDPAAELDAETQRCLLQLIARLSGQTLVSLPALPRDLDRFADARVFHVKRGKIRELLE